MDVLRSYSVQQARLLAGSDDTTPIRWYRCAPGALSFPGFHAFGSPVWEGDERQVTVGPGVNFYPLQWAPTKYPAPAGLHYHGELSWYQDGLPAKGTAPTDACGVPLMLPVGGLRLDGRAVMADEIVLSSGSLSLTSTTVLVEGPSAISEPCRCLATITTVSVYPRVVSEPCRCLATITTVSVYPRVISEPCRCLATITTVSVYPRVLSEPCRCLATITTVAINYIDSAGCLCIEGETELRAGPAIDSAGCLCIEGETELRAGPAIDSAGCLCVEGETLPGPVWAAEGCVCIDADTGIVYPPPPPPPCPYCEGPTPATWTITSLGFTGECDVFNGSFVCVWWSSVYGST